MTTSCSRVVAHRRSRSGGTSSSIRALARARSILVTPALVATALLWLSAPAAAATCSTVAADFRLGVAAVELDPQGNKLSKLFDNEVAVNADGDTMFVNQPLKERDRLYLYPLGAVGGGEVVATGGDTAPNGKTFSKNAVFRNVSINDPQDLAFSASFMGGGHGVFVREFGGALETAADTFTTAVPVVGGFFASFRSVSLINANAQIAFIGINRDGAKGVFLYDAPTDTLTNVMQKGDVTTTPAGRQVCEFVEVGLGDSGEVVVRGTTDSVAGGCDGAAGAVFYTDAGDIVEIARHGEASPIPGFNYGVFTDGVFMNASGNSVFRASAGGGRCLFLHDPTGPSTTDLVCQGDATPAGGTFGVPAIYQLADTDEAFLVANVVGGPTLEGIFSANGGTATILTRETATPADVFAGGRYTNFLAMGIDAGATHLVFRAALKETPPKQTARQAIVSCTLP